MKGQYGFYCNATKLTLFDMIKIFPLPCITNPDHIEDVKAFEYIRPPYIK
jgi:hypothetical protein